MQRIAAGIERAMAWLAALCGWLVLALVLLAFALVAMRYLADLGWIAGQETVLWLHGAVFMLGAAAALSADRHVRVDLLHQGISPRAQAWIELLGTLLLLWPFCVLMFSISLDYVAASWAQNEASREPGGLPAVYLLKSLIPLSAVLLAIAGLGRVLRAMVVLREPA